MKFLPHIQKTILPFYLAIFAITNDIEISAVQRFIIIYKVFNISISSKPITVFAIILVLIYFQPHFIKDKKMNRRSSIYPLYCKIVVRVG